MDLYTGVHVMRHTACGNLVGEHGKVTGSQPPRPRQLHHRYGMQHRGEKMPPATSMRQLCHPPQTPPISRSNRMRSSKNGTGQSTTAACMDLPDVKACSSTQRTHTSSAVAMIIREHVEESPAQDSCSHLMGRRCSHTLAGQEETVNMSPTVLSCTHGAKILGGTLHLDVTEVALFMENQVPVRQLEKPTKTCT